MYSAFTMRAGQTMVTRLTPYYSELQPYLMSEPIYYARHSQYATSGAETEGPIGFGLARMSAEPVSRFNLKNQLNI